MAVDDRHAGHHHAPPLDSEMQHPRGPHVHQHGDHAHVHDSTRDGIVFYTMLLGMFGMQLLLKWWKTKSPRSFHLASLLGLWLFPFLSAAVQGSLRFVAVWVVFSALGAFYLHLARQKPLKTTTPRRVYTFFDRMYRLSSSTAMWSYSAMVVCVFLPPLQLLLPRWCVEVMLAGMIYGTYFCVVTRDLTEYAADTIANSLGYTKKHDDDEVAKPVPRGLCALCGDDLRAAGEGSAEEEGLAPTEDGVDGMPLAMPRALGHPAAGAVGSRAPTSSSSSSKGRRPGAGGGSSGSSGAPGDQRRATVRLRGSAGESLYRLECGHTYHDACIKGWVVVGKKGMCPCCLERVDLRSIIGSTLWARPGVLWTQILDAVRYFVVWLPLLLLGVRFVLYEAGVDLTSTILVGEGNATGVAGSANGTAALLTAATFDGGAAASAGAAAAMASLAAAPAENPG